MACSLLCARVHGKHCGCAFNAQKEATATGTQAPSATTTTAPWTPGTTRTTCVSR